ISLANVPREVFSINPIQAAMTASQIEAGPIELTVHDLGIVDLAVARHAGAENTSRDAARQAIVEDIRENGAELAVSNPDIKPIAESLAHFIEAPGTTFTIKLTPLGKVPALQLMQMLQTDPLSALSLFRLEAATAL